MVNKIFFLLFFFIVSAQAMHRVDMRKTYARHNQERVCKADHRLAPDSCPCSFKSRCTYLPQIGGLGALLLISMMASGMLVDQVQSAPISYLEIGTDKDCENLPFKGWRWCCRTEMLPDENFVIKRCMRRDGKSNSSAILTSTAAIKEISKFKKLIPYE